MNTIDQRLMELKTIDTQIETLTKQKDELRKEVFGIVENEGMTEGYKNEYATVAYVTRKSVKIADEKALIKDLESKKIVKYLEIIPKHTELTSEFSKDIKDGKFTHELVTVEESNGLQLKFK